jgi:hypothetical protein
LKNSDDYAKFCEEEDAKHWVDCCQSRTGGTSYKGYFLLLDDASWRS